VPVGWFVGGRGVRRRSVCAVGVPRQPSKRTLWYGGVKRQRARSPSPRPPRVYIAVAAAAAAALHGMPRARLTV